MFQAVWGGFRGSTTGLSTFLEADWSWWCPWDPLGSVGWNVASAVGTSLDGGPKTSLWTGVSLLWSQKARKRIWDVD